LISRLGIEHRQNFVDGLQIASIEQLAGAASGKPLTANRYCEVPLFFKRWLEKRRCLQTHYFI
jgi:hypothetical protein